MSISSFFALLSVAPQILSLVDQAVVSVESSLSGFSGAQKLEAALAKIHGWLGAAGTDISTIAGIQPLMTALVKTSVDSFNAAKAFSRATPQTTPTP